ARQMKADFPLPLVQAPGLGDAPGFPRLPVRVPWDQQTTVLSEFPATTPISNLSVPGLTIAEAASRRPVPPAVHQSDGKQTAITLILGRPGLLKSAGRLPTQLEYALQRKPTLAVVELGYADALEAAAIGDPNLIPDGAAARSAFATIVSSLGDANCDIVVMTIPDPMDTAHFSTAASASRVVKLPAREIEREYGLGAGDRILVNGLTEMGYQLMAGRGGPLPSGSILRAAAAADISSRVQRI